MKKLIILGLMAISPLALTASSVKTSKPVPLSTAQMASIKGQGVVTIWVWDADYCEYEFSMTQDSGPNGPNILIHIGGPQAGSIFY